MARTDQTSGGGPANSSDKAIWEYSRAIDVEPDEAERFLDVAGFTDTLLADEDERARVAALLADDPDAAGDVAAARALAGTVPAAGHAIVTRAIGLVDSSADEGFEQRSEVVPFAPPARARLGLYRAASWGSLAASIAIAGWLGFALGSDVSLAYGQVARSGDDGFLGDLIDPAGGVLRSINDGLEL